MVDIRWKKTDRSAFERYFGIKEKNKHGRKGWAAAPTAPSTCCARLTCWTIESVILRKMQLKHHLRRCPWRTQYPALDCTTYAESMPCRMAACPSETEYVGPDTKGWKYNGSSHLHFRWATAGAFAHHPRNWVLSAAWRSRFPDTDTSTGGHWVSHYNLS